MYNINNFKNPTATLSRYLSCVEVYHAKPIKQIRTKKHTNKHV